jgi:mannose-6-phosphate isomerase-like protein (cupin superfamily)
MKGFAKGSGRASEASRGAGFVRRPWGGFETIEEGPGYKVKRLLVEPGRRLSLQRHRFRAESWVVVDGSPRMIVSGRPQRVRAREMVRVPRGAWHRIENPGTVPVTIIEVQHGEYLGEDDIIRREDDYGRAAGSAPRSGENAFPTGTGSEPHGARGPSSRRRARRRSPKSRTRA